MNKLEQVREEGWSRGEGSSRGYIPMWVGGFHVIGPVPACSLGDPLPL